MHILALEPYYGGSHKAFLDGWSGAGRHDCTILQLPPYKWKWRMRHAAVTFADQLARRPAQAPQWNMLFASDMLNLAEFRGLAGRDIAALPTILYFHENQFTYPVRVESERDYQLAMTNMTSALAADAVWFNSAFHQESFLTALDAFLRRMPDHQPTDAIERIRAKASVHPPGVQPLTERKQRDAGPLRIAWAARWEHDKNPEDLFAALQILKTRDVAFRLSVVGEQFREMPEIFAAAREEFADRIECWGYQESRAAYLDVLRRADVFVSTARHEFFGLSAIEAALAGAYPLLPKRLAYPEVFALPDEGPSAPFLYDGTPQALAERLIELAQSLAQGASLYDRARAVRDRLKQFEWPTLAPTLDDAAEQVVETAQRDSHPAK
jgi:glycosyltransferase involved in cell wall biosynthesis